MNWLQHMQTLATSFLKPAGGASLYIQLLYGPLMIYNHTQGQVSGSIKYDPINMIHTSQDSTKQVFNKKIEGDFRSIKLKPKEQYLIIKQSKK